MRDDKDKKIRILSAKDAAAQSLMAAQPATMLDLAPIHETLLNVGAGLHGIARLLEDFERRVAELEEDSLSLQRGTPPYTMYCDKCSERPRWVKSYTEDNASLPITRWECLLGCGKTPMKSQEVPS